MRQMESFATAPPLCHNVQKFRRKGWNRIQPEKELQKDESQIKTNKV